MIHHLVLSLLLGFTNAAAVHLAQSSEDHHLGQPRELEALKVVQAAEASGESHEAAVADEAVAEAVEQTAEDVATTAADGVEAVVHKPDNAANTWVASAAAHSLPARQPEFPTKAQVDQSGNDDDGDEYDDDSEPSANEEVILAADPVTVGVEGKLAANGRKQADLKAKLKFLSDKKLSDQEIDADVAMVGNETQSKALGGMLGGMWKEMRMFGLPAYTEHANEEIKSLKKEEVALAKELASSTGKDAAVESPSEQLLNYGNGKCECIGIDQLEGETLVTLTDGSQKPYPADLGARCEAWDLSNHPKCPGASWCQQKWCYVDPCKCDISVLPKPSVYLPGAKYQGRPVHFSYDTCGAQDVYSAKEDKKSAKEIAAVCKTEVDADSWGSEECRCVGISPQQGFSKVSIEGKLVKFPVDTGARCSAWDGNNHPECKGDKAPDWCKKTWCYVDPCSCRLPTPPKASSYVPDASYQGTPVYYSYEACGATDEYTSGRKEACVNQKTEDQCNKLPKCAWDGRKQCLGKELVSVCSGDKPDKSEKSAPSNVKSAAFALQSVLLLLLPLTYFV